MPSDFLTSPLEVGRTVTRAYPVEAGMLTHHVPESPGVLMTPNLIALFEDAAAEIVRPLLATGAAAVGTWVGVHHTGPAGLGEVVTVTATVTALDGRKIHYEVAALVDERPVGHGEIGFTLVRR